MTAFEKRVVGLRKKQVPRAAWGAGSGRQRLKKRGGEAGLAATLEKKHFLVLGWAPAVPGVVRGVGVGAWSRVEDACVVGGHFEVARLFFAELVAE